MAAVAGQTHKHLGTVIATASRNRPVRVSLLIVPGEGDRHARPDHHYSMPRLLTEKGLSI